MYICQDCIGGGGGGGWDYAQIVPLKITIVVPNDSLVIFGRFSHLHCNYDTKRLRDQRLFIHLFASSINH